MMSSKEIFLILITGIIVSIIKWILIGVGILIAAKFFGVI